MHYAGHLGVEPNTLVNCVFEARLMERYENNHLQCTCLEAMQVTSKRLSNFIKSIQKQELVTYG